MTDGTELSQADLWKLLRERRNWGRWGDDDQVGAVNMITPDKRLRALQSVRSGQMMSLSLPFPSVADQVNQYPAQHIVMQRIERGTGGTVLDYVGISYHGIASTHIDALCHTWDVDGMWGGRDPSVEIKHDGVRWGDIDKWRDGLMTRGVLLDVPRHRGVGYVDVDSPVHGEELEAIAASQGITLEPGDALVVHSGRAAFNRDRHPWGASGAPSQERGIPNKAGARPGLHASCLEFLRDSDCSILVWDMMDATPFDYDLAFTVHSAAWAFGVALVDNASLGELARACQERGADDFLLVLAPLPVVGGTGSPVNPLALL